MFYCKKLQLITKMAQTLVKLNEHEDQVLTVVKGKYGLKNKNDAIRFVIDKFEEELLEPQLRPEYTEKLKRMEKAGNFKSYNSIAGLRKEIGNA
ncbi:DUF2683 family protein [Candidatus Woesearchaeota archaeon]|nr:DUF2683 family protein [Candidatus Woesearchaeota archaeon]